MWNQFRFLHNMGNIKQFVVVALVLLLGGCNIFSKNKNREKPDVSKIEINAPIMRFDQDLQNLRNTNCDENSVNATRSKYGSFFDFYVSQFVIGPRQPGDTAPIEKDALRKFLADGYINHIQDSINRYFADTKDIEADLTQSLKYFKYYAPEMTVPKIVTVNSGFSLGAFTYEKDVLGIGLDLYLGADNPDYDSAGIYSSVRHKMRREYINRNSMEVLYNFYFGSEELSHGKPLVEAMVDKGKKMYFLSYVLPDAPDSMIVGFTQTQTTWCEQNEVEIWKFLNDKDLLYKDNYMDQKRYLDEGPGIAGMPAEA